MNTVILMGRLTKAPELRHTGDGTAVCSWTLAIDRIGKDQTDFIDCVAWRDTAQFVAQYFDKGRMMACVGSLSIRDWTDKDKNKRRSYEVNVNRVEFCGDKAKQDFEKIEEPDIELPFD